MATFYSVLGANYHNYENAVDAAREVLTKADIFEKFNVDFYDILVWCFQNDAFLEHFEEEIFQAEDEAIEEILIEHESSDNEEFFEKAEFMDEEEKEE